MKKEKTSWILLLKIIINQIKMQWQQVPKNLWILDKEASARECDGIFWRNQTADESLRLHMYKTSCANVSVTLIRNTNTNERLSGITKYVSPNGLLQCEPRNCGSFFLLNSSSDWWFFDVSQNANMFSMLKLPHYNVSLNILSLLPNFLLPSLNCC